MIDSDVLRTSREVGRFKLTPEDAKRSYGYWIDIPNDWETYSSPEDMIEFLGIHRTHADRYNDIIEDLGPLSAAEFRWAERYINLYERIARLLTTTGFRVDLKHDVAETAVDWRIIRKYAELPCKILDFGAGCFRHGVSAQLWEPRNIYAAVDATLAAYTTQNLVMSYLDTLQPEASSHDFLDYEKAGKAFPDIRGARPGDRFHLPTWLAEDHLPADFFDVIIAVHVHNELSGSDFMRLARIIDKSLAKDGIVHVRGEQAAKDTMDYFDTVDLHGIEMVRELAARGISPVSCEVTSAYLTTVFARVGSVHYNRVKDAGGPEKAFLDMNDGRVLSAKAGEMYSQRQAEALKQLSGRVALIGKGEQFYNLFFEPVEQGVAQRLVFTEKDILNPATRRQTLEALTAFNPDAVAISSQQWQLIESLVTQAMGNVAFGLRKRYWYPVIVLQKKIETPIDKIFERPIFGPADIEHARYVSRP